MVKKIFSLLILLIILPLISSNGLQIISPDSISINKTLGISKTIDIVIKNQEPIDFYNVTIKEDFIQMPKVSLLSGENKTVPITISKDEDFNGEITLIGDYYSSIGVSNYTQEIEIDYTNSRISPCNINLVVGDSVLWKNLHYDSIKLINSGSGGEVAVIQGSANFQKKFDVPISLDYYASWIGFKFTQTCNINIMDSSGYVHNSEYDGKINLNIKMEYEPTEIEPTFYETNYEIQYNKESEDILRIKNIGNKIAKKIHLSGEWFEFEKNDFDLNSGESINIPYKINPYIYETNQTDKNYTKTLKIEGNFNTIEKNFTIFIPYSKVTAIFSGDVDEDVIIEFFKYFCQEDEDKCVDLFCSIYPEICEGLNSDSNVTQSFSSSTLKELIEKLFQITGENEVSKKTQIESDTTQTAKIEEMGLTLNKTLEKVLDLEENYNNSATTNMFLIIFVLFILCGGVLIIIYKKEVVLKSIRKKLNFHRGENA